MKRLSAATWGFAGIDFHELLHRLEHLGYDGVELGAFAPHPTPKAISSKDQRTRLSRMVADHGLAFSGLAPDLRHCQLCTVGDPAPYFAAFDAHLSFAADLGIATVRIHTSDTTESLKEHGIVSQIAIDRTVLAFHRCAQLAAARGIRLAWELRPDLAVHEPSEVVEVTSRVRNELGNANFGVLLDVNTTSTWPGGSMEMLQQLHGTINHVQLAAATGDVQASHLGPVLAQLDAAAQAHDWWCVAPACGSDPWSALAEARPVLDKLRRKYR